MPPLDPEITSMQIRESQQCHYIISFREFEFLLSISKKLRFVVRIIAYPVLFTYHILPLSLFENFLFF